MPNGVAAPGNVLPSPNNELVLAPMSGLMYREARLVSFRGTASSLRRDKSDDNQMRVPLLNDRRVIVRAFSRVINCPLLLVSGSVDFFMTFEQFAMISPIAERSTQCAGKSAEYFF